LYSLRASGAFSASPVVPFVRITASRRRIDPREPTVGFTLITDQRFAEVFIATSPELFLPENEARRTASTWFSSRLHGLLEGPGEIPYVVPAAFVASAVKAEPRPARLYYLASCHSDHEGGPAAWSVLRSEWPGAIPWIDVAPELHAAGIASTLGVALGRLARVVGPSVGVLAGGHGASPGTAFAAAPAVTWRQEASGAIGVPRLTRGLEAEGDAHPCGDHVPRGGYEAGAACGDPPAAHREAVAPSHAEPLDYDDGYGAPDARSLDSTFPAGTMAPDDLPDEEDPYEDEASWQAGAEPPRSGAGGNPAELDTILDAMARGRGATSLFVAVGTTPSDGVALGVLRATQRSGELGALLAYLRGADGAAFDRAIGGPEQAQALIATTTASTESARMQPVRGESLGSPTWQATLSRAAEALIEPQRRYVKERVLEPLLAIARDLGLASVQSMTMLACILVAKGLEAGMAWVLDGISPVGSPAQLALALPALGQRDLASFQIAEGLRPSGELDTRTRARLTRKLRELEARSPVPVLTPAQMRQTLLRQAQGEPFLPRLQGLATSDLDTRDI
jgi:hypothetical protein